MFNFFSNGYNKVPQFIQYYPTLESLNQDQLKYFKWFVKKLEKDVTPDVQGNISYVFLALYITINRFIKDNNYKQLAENFEALNPYINEYDTIRKYAYQWHRDAALLASNWQEVWEHGRKCKLDTTIISHCISKESSIKIGAKDLYSFLNNNHGLTNYGSDNINSVNKIADNILNEHHETEGVNFLRSILSSYNWQNLSENDVLEIADECDYLYSIRKFKNTLKKVDTKSTNTYILFQSVPMDMVHSKEKNKFEAFSIETQFSMRADKPEIKLESVNPVLDLVILAKSKSILREAENLLREKRELPRIGEGWISETKLYQEIKTHFNNTAVVQHARPEWLKPQHLDVFLPIHKIAIEFQGDQHIRPVDYFGGEKAFKQQKKRDERKIKLCQENNCQLIEVHQGYNIEKVLEKISTVIGESEQQSNEAN
ncbi:MAG: hypothetical protein R6V36_05480 [Psychroflexus sp.]